MPDPSPSGRREKEPFRGSPQPPSKSQKSDVFGMIHGKIGFQPNRKHLYQRLVISGYSHLAITVLYLLLAAVGVLLSICWYVEIPGSSSFITLTLIVLGTALAFLPTFRNSKINGSSIEKRP